MTSMDCVTPPLTAQQAGPDHVCWHWLDAVNQTYVNIWSQDPGVWSWEA